MSSQTGPAGAARRLFAVPVDGAPAPGKRSALEQLADLAEQGASGELVCSTAGGEIHVYLQAGRIAWASSTGQRHAFTDRLKAVTGADDEVIEAVVAECSRTHRPIGEGLIAWKVATAEQVRASLRHQIRGALAGAARDPGARTLFLERAHYCRYDRDLTFQLAEVVAGDSAGSDPAPASTAARGPAAELAATEGLAAAAVLSAQGEPLAIVGDAAPVPELAGLAHRLLQEGQRLSIDLGAGLCRELHVEAADAHLLVYSTRRAHLAGPGAWLRVVLVLRDPSRLALARERVDALAAGLLADAGR
jgi:hypothetical protein